MKTKKVLSSLSFSGKLLIGLCIIAPVVIGFSLSLMTLRELSSVPPRFLPQVVDFYAYIEALRLVPVFRFLANSLVVCTIVMGAQVITCSLAAYAFAFFDFKFKRVLFIAVLSTIMIPVDSIIIANFLTIANLYLLDSYAGLTLPFMTSAIGIFILRQFFLTIPKELHEAAVIDGCGHTRFLLSVVIPLSKPAIASLCVYIFIMTYNQFLWPLLVTNTTSMRTAQIGIAFLSDSEAVNYAVVLAASMMVLVPSILVFVLGQKYLIKGMTAGAVKG